MFPSTLCVCVFVFLCVLWVSVVIIFVCVRNCRIVVVLLLVFNVILVAFMMSWDMHCGLLCVTKCINVVIQVLNVLDSSL